MINSILTSFNAGELSPRLWSRVDLDKYASGCRILENFIVMPYGGVNRRPGTQFIGEVKDSAKKVRLIGFNFSITTNFVLEFGDLYIRFYSNGAQVKVSSTPFEIVSPYAQADLFELQYCQINDVMYIAHQNYPVYKLSRLGDTNWTIAQVAWDYPPFRDENITATTITPSAVTGTGILLSATDTIFAPGDVGGYYRIGSERSSTTAKLAITANANTTPINVLGKWEFTTTGIWKATISVQSSLDGGTTWDTVRSFDGDSDRNITTTGTQEKDSLMRISITNHVSHTSPTYAYLDAVEATVYGVVKITAVASAGTKAITAITYLGSLTYRLTVTGHGFFVGQAIAISGPGPTGIELLGNHTVTSITDANTITVLVGAGTNGTPASQTGTITTSANQAIADVVKDLLNTTATPHWAEGEWSTRRGFPRSVTLHQQRLFFGGNAAHAVTLWGSNIGDFENFLVTTFDDSSLNLTFSASEQNAINWILSYKQQLIIGTSGEEWLLQPATANSALTPTSLDMRRQSRYGSAHLQATLANNAPLYVQRKGRKVQELFYNWQIDGFVSQDLTLLSDHVTKGEIIQTAFQQQLDAILWCVTGDGILAGMTYDRNQNVVSWHRHTTDGTFESVATIYGATEGDEIWVIVNRTINGVTKRFIERFDPAYRESLDDEAKLNWIYVDSATTPTPNPYFAKFDFTTWDDNIPVGNLLTITDAVGNHAYFALDPLGTGWDGTKYLIPFSFTGDAIAGDFAAAINDYATASSTPFRATATADSPTVIRVTQTDTGATGGISGWGNVAVFITPFSGGGITFTGLGHLEGKTVSVLADGSVHPDLTVTSGAITLQYHATNVIAGLPYTSTIQPMSVDIGQMQGGTPQGRHYKVHRVSIRFYKSLGGQIQTAPNTWDPIPFRDDQNPMDQSPPAFTGEIEMQVSGDYGKTADITIRQIQPLPMSILALIAKTDVFGD